MSFDIYYQENVPAIGKEARDSGKKERLLTINASPDKVIQICMDECWVELADDMAEKFAHKMIEAFKRANLLPIKPSSPMV